MSLTMTFAKLLVGAVLLVSSTQALDIKVSSVTCDESLPVYAVAETFSVICNGSDKCTFGEEAQISGELVYAGVESADAYMTSTLKFTSLQYTLFEMLEVDLCDGDIFTAGEDNANACPGDGSYGFDLAYTLPASSSKTSWLATGWQGTGEVTVYSDKDVDTKIGYCTFTLGTSVTASSATGAFTAPSAAKTSGILLAVVAVALVAGVYLSFRGRGKPAAPREDGTAFSRMDDQSAVTSKSGAKSAASAGGNMA